MTRLYKMSEAAVAEATRRSQAALELLKRVPASCRCGHKRLRWVEADVVSTYCPRCQRATSIRMDANKIKEEVRQ